MTDNSNFI